MRSRARDATGSRHNAIAIAHLAQHPALSPRSPLFPQAVRKRPRTSQALMPLGKGSTELAGDADGAAPRGVPTSGSWGDEVLASDEEEQLYG